MIKLYGTPISNYFSTAKLALVEKDIEFEEIDTFPSQDEKVTAASPMGKVPWIEVDGRTLSETNVIFDYLEESRPTPPLYPADPWDRAKAREIVRTVELYLDAPARRHIATVYFGADVDPLAFEQARPALENGLRAFRQLAQFAPFVAGDMFTYADIATYFQLRFANLHTTAIYDWDIVATDPQIADYIAMLQERSTVAAVDGVMQEAFAAFKKPRG